VIIAGLFGTLLAGVPLALGLVGLLLAPGDGGRRTRRAAAALGIGGAAISLAVTVFLLLVATVFPRHSANEPIEFSRRWINLGGIEVTVGFSAGAVALYVALAVTVVALAVQVYSVAYLHDDRRYAPYAAQVSLFTGAMLLVVTSGDLILMLVGWEVMGACSYLLIGHDRRLPEAPRAAG
jgi:NADH-quinone oxidoreductase subunit L